MRGGVENPGRSHYGEPLGFSGGNTRAVIHKDFVNLDGSGPVSSATSRAPLRSKAHQVAPFLLQISEGVLSKHGMSLEKPIQRGTRFIARQLPQLGLGEMPAFVLFQRKCLQRAARLVTARGSQPLG